jgi:hypothetical protein
MIAPERWKPKPETLVHNRQLQIETTQTEESRMKRYVPMVALVATVLCALAAVPARAAEIPIDISGLVNEPWTFAGPGAFIQNGSTFPTGSQNFGGVPFSIPAGSLGGAP